MRGDGDESRVEGRRGKCQAALHGCVRKKGTEKNNAIDAKLMDDLGGVEMK